MKDNQSAADGLELAKALVDSNLTSVGRGDLLIRQDDKILTAYRVTSVEGCENDTKGAMHLTVLWQKDCAEVIETVDADTPDAISQLV